jgi:hypothetical protein
MHLTLLRLTFVLLGAWLVFGAWAQRELGASASIAGAGGPVKRVLVLYQTDVDSLGTELHATMAANLVGRFGRADVRDLNHYALKDAAAYDALIVLPSARGTAPPHTLIADVRGAKKPVIWIHHAAQALFADSGFANVQGWHPSPPQVAAHERISYKQIDIPSVSGARALVTAPVIRDPSRAIVLASAVLGRGGETPWAVRSGNLLFLLESPFSSEAADERHLVFADLLFDILAPPATSERPRALLRIENSRAGADPRIRELLAREEVPYSHGLSAPQLAGIRRGQVRYFAGEARGRADPARGEVSQSFPFETVDRRGNFVIPENLGRADRGAAALLDAAGRLVAVRGALASFVHVEGDDPAVLRNAIQGMKRLGYVFVSEQELIATAPAHFPHRLRDAPKPALAAAGWVDRLPPLSWPVLSGFLLLIVALWLAGESAIDALFRPRRRTRSHRYVAAA